MSHAVVVISAHAFEARAVAGVGRGMSKEPWGQWTLYRGEMWDHDLCVIRCGPGKVAAAAAAQAAVQYLDPGVMISFGTAGCPDPKVRQGTLAVSSRVVDVALTELGRLPVHIPDRFEADPELLACFMEVPGTVASSLLCWEGHVVSPLHRPASCATASDVRLVIVDWESAAVAHVAEMWDLPWIALKVVSDHGEAERLRLLALAAKRPLQWAAEVLRRACHTYLLTVAGAGDGCGSMRHAENAEPTREEQEERLEEENDE